MAAGVIQQLGLQQTPTSFAGTYTVTAVTDQVLKITVSAPTSDEAVQRASAVAAQFLKFRAQYEETQQQQTEAQLNQQISQAQQHLDSITTQISQVSSQPSSTAQEAQLSTLQGATHGSERHTGCCAAVRDPDRGELADAHTANGARQ